MKFQSNESIMRMHKALESKFDPPSRYLHDPLEEKAPSAPTREGAIFSTEIDDEVFLDVERSNITPPNSWLKNSDGTQSKGNGVSLHIDINIWTELLLLEKGRRYVEDIAKYARPGDFLRKTTLNWRNYQTILFINEVISLLFCSWKGRLSEFVLYFLVCWRSKWRRSWILGLGTLSRRPLDAVQLCPWTRHSFSIHKNWSGPKPWMRVRRKEKFSFLWEMLLRKGQKNPFHHARNSLLSKSSSWVRHFFQSLYPPSGSRGKHHKHPPNAHLQASPPPLFLLFSLSFTREKKLTLDSKQ